MNRVIVAKIFEIFKKNNPSPTTELQYRNEFELLIAVILSAQATDISVNKVTPQLFKLAPTPEKMVALGLPKLKQIIKTIGLYNTKAANIIKASKKILSDFEGKVPAVREDLESLPGVGRKTANVVLNTAFDQHTIAVDTHILRVANRIGLAKSSKPEIVEQQLEQIIPPQSDIAHTVACALCKFEAKNLT